MKIKNNVWYKASNSVGTFFVKYSDYQNGVASHVIYPLGGESRWWTNVRFNTKHCYTETPTNNIERYKEQISSKKIKPNKHHISFLGQQIGYYEE